MNKLVLHVFDVLLKLIGQKYVQLEVIGQGLVKSSQANHENC